MYSSYGKMPAFVKIAATDEPSYNINEILPLMKKGDSAVTVQMVDTLLNRGEQLPQNLKKGDRITTTLRILEVFNSDSLARANYEMENEKDKPRQLKEQQEQMAKMEKEMQEAQAKEELELQKSGEIDREIKEMEDYLARKNIKAQKTGKGTFVEIKQQGSGAQALPGKYVKVKYTGRFLSTDSIFQSNNYAFQLGKRAVIAGWDEGLLLFKQGGKGVLYVPGFLAYGKNPPQGSPFKPFEAMKFDVELLNVSDTAITQ
jgi:FKBP-type peptidyl-prolyl cis-trans isomerase